MRSSVGWALGVLALLGLALSSAGRHSLVNLWLSATDSDYLVPDSSTWARFKPTVMNPGSGGWWLYGEDPSRYYHFIGSGSPPYRAISREAAHACAGFDPHRVETWCA
jgi:hypothetical protein